MDAVVAFIAFDGRSPGEDPEPEDESDDDLDEEHNLLDRHDKEIR